MSGTPAVPASDAKDIGNGAGQPGSITSKFNNDLIHSDKDSNGKAIVHNSTHY